MDRKKAAHIIRASNANNANESSSTQIGSNTSCDNKNNPTSALSSEISSARKGKSSSQKEKPPLSPYDSASWISKALFHWPMQIIRLCLAKDRFNPNSVPTLNRELESSRNSAAFVKAFADQELTIFNLWKCILKIYWQDNLFLFVAHLMEIIGNIISTLTMGQIIDELGNKNPKANYSAITTGIGLSFLGLIIKAFANQHLTYRATMTGAKVRVGLTAFLYSRLLNMKLSCGISSAKVVNFVSNDLQRYENVFPLLHYTYMPWIEFLVTIYFLHDKLGNITPALVGGTVILILFALQMLVSFQMVAVQEKLSQKRDEVVKIISDTFSGILPIKCFNWQHIFEDEINTSREKIEPLIRKMNVLEGANTSLHFVAPNLSVFFLCLVQIIFLRNSLDEAKVIMINAFFTLSSFSMSYLLPIAIAGVGQINVAHERFIKICDAIEVGEDKQIEYSIGEGDNSCIRFENVSISWNRIPAASPEDSSEESDKLSEIPKSVNLKSFVLDISHLDIQKGEFVALVGPVGCGKTTFLLSLLDEANISPSQADGRLFLCQNEKISYSPQVPWLLSGSIRENILLGRPLDEAQYKKVLTTCCLDKDLTSFPEGDLKHVGERGSSLSGGQRARVALARMFYAADASIYLLDDVMSAVDGKVANELFGNISLFLQEAPKDIHSLKTCIMATHQLQFLHKFDKIIVLGDGKVEFFGDYAQLQASDCDISHALSEFEDKEESESEESEVEVEESESEIDLPQQAVDSISSVPNPDISVVSGRASIHSRCISSHPIHDDQAKKPTPNRLNLTNTEETISTGEVSRETYKKFLFASKPSWFNTSSIVLFSILCQICINAFDHLLEKWSKIAPDSQRNIPYPLAIGILTIFIVALLYLRAHLFLMRIADSSKELFRKMVHSVLHTHMKFFVQNPQGRILNRFTNDQTTLDECIGSDLFDTFQCSIYAIAIFIYIVLSSPWSLLFLLILIPPIVHLRNKFVTASRKCKRVEGVLRSPVYSLLGSTLQGLPEIRSLKHIDTFQALFVSYLDSYSSVSFCYHAVSRWIGIWIDGLFCLYYLIFCLALLLLRYLRDSHPNWNFLVDSNNIGLSLMYTQQLTGLIQWVIRQSSEVENLMTSAERVLEYTQLQDEDEILPSDSSTTQLIVPPAEWPTTGAISIEKMTLTYRTKKEAVLKGVSLQILDGEDVGLVGRTGAGKSSLIYALFRIFDPQPLESIKIDGIPINRISKSRLRQAIAIIPQEAIIFSNTVRFNLDPTGKATDAEMWDAIEQVQMKDSDLFPEGLDTKIDPSDGNSLSSGQKQLLCLARAILMRRKIVVMDEATANVDLVTSQQMQEAMKKAFEKSTVCTIAHRLKTIIEYDKVIVLEAGKVKEVEHPYVLLCNPHSAFSQMVREQGKENEESMLIEMARQSFKENHPQRYFEMYGDGAEVEEEAQPQEKNEDHFPKQ